MDVTTYICPYSYTGLNNLCQWYFFAWTPLENNGFDRLPMKPLCVKFAFSALDNLCILWCFRFCNWLSLWCFYGSTTRLLYVVPWWRHQMETFSALLAICTGNSPVPGEFPTQKPVTRSCDVFFDLRLNKRLSKQSWGWWFETLSCPLWLQCNDFVEGSQTKDSVWLRQVIVSYYYM